MALQPSKTFHWFLQLPAELRLMIWESAARGPDLPSVHFFSLWNHNAAKVEGACEPLIFPNTWDESKSPWQCLGAPDGRTTSSRRGYSWSHNNASAYLIDMGLWTACAESRAVMQSLYRNISVVPLITPRRLYPPQDASTTAWIRHRADQPLNKIFMSLKTDLLCLTNVSLHGLESWQSRCSSPTHFPRRVFLSGASHLGLPYHPDWDKLARFPYPDNYMAHCYYLYTHVRYITGPSKIWFIDYRIKIGSLGLERLQKKGHAVFNGMGLRLVEIREPAQTGHEVATGKKALDFIDIFDEICEGHRPQWQPFHSSWGSIAALGVLACVYDSRG